MYPRQSKWSPDMTPADPRQTRRARAWFAVTIPSMTVMIVTWLAAGNIGDRQLYCTLVASATAVVTAVCLCAALPAIVRAMRRELESPIDTRRTIGAFVLLFITALTAATLAAVGGRAFAQRYDDVRTGYRTLPVSRCEKYETQTRKGRRNTTYYSTVFTLHFEGGGSRRFEISTDSKDEFQHNTSPHHPVFQACVEHPRSTSIIVDLYPRSGVVKAIRYA